MKRTLAIWVAVVSLLTACNARNEVKGTQIFDYNDKFIYNNGEFYTDNYGRLCYFDFTSMKGTFICPKPNCPHDDSNTCSAFGMNNHAVAMNNSIYFFEPETYWTDDGTLAERTNVCKAKLDGTGRMKVGTIDDICLVSFQPALFKDGVLYFGSVKNSFAETESGMREIYLIGYDLKENCLSLSESLGEFFEPSISFAGELSGEVYFNLNYHPEKTDIQGIGEDPTDEELAEYVKQLAKVVSERKILKCNLESGEIADCEIPSVNWKTPEKGIWLQAKYGYMIFTDCTDTLVISGSGDDVLIEGFNGADEAVVNGYLFPSLSAGKNTAYRLSDGAEVTVSVEDSSVKGGYVVDFCDGEYILRYIDLKRQKTVYATASVGEEK